jgi:hypothetical protein
MLGMNEWLVFRYVSVFSAASKNSLQIEEEDGCLFLTWR